MALQVRQALKVMMTAIAAAEAGAPADAYRRALQLRFQVYCLECNFLAPEGFPQGMESDEHDADAAHFYAFDAHDDLVGYVRLVHADVHGRFPLQAHCRLDPSQTLAHPSQAAEVSRLMVRRDYRRRRGDRLAGVTAAQHRAVLAGERRHQAPQILLSLYRQMYAYSCRNGIRVWYAAMDRALFRSLKRLSFCFTPLGPQSDYFGPVIPYMGDLLHIEREVGVRYPGLLHWLQSSEPVHGQLGALHGRKHDRIDGPDDDALLIAGT